MSNIKEAMELMGRIIDKYGEEKGAKVVECIHGVTLALNCYDQDIGKAALREIADLWQRVDASQSADQ